MTIKRSWRICKCDIDQCDIESFLHRMGFPMYAEVYRGKNLFPGFSHLKYALAMNRLEIESILEIKNKTHLQAVWSGLEFIRSLMILK